MLTNEQQYMISFEKISRKFINCKGFDRKLGFSVDQLACIDELRSELTVVSFAIINLLAWGFHKTNIM